MSRRLILVRHGRSAHLHSGWLDTAGLYRWRDAYDAAAILDDPPPPPALRALAADAGIVVASDMPRAIASAELLLQGTREFTVSPLIRETEMKLGAESRVKLPLMGWALMFGVWALQRRLRGERPSERLLARAAEAARWLEGLSEAHGTVLAVTHASFRGILRPVLMESGWAPPRSRSLKHWSAWEFRR